MANMEMANTIINQLGGNKFIAMTGAKQFLAIENGVRMTIGKNTSQANRLEIILNGDDTYSMRFYKYTAPKINSRTLSFTDEKVKEIENINGVYCDMLQEAFTRVTGMYTSL